MGTADQLPALYPDRARGRVFGTEELLTLAQNVGEEVYFQESDGMSLSAAELFGMFVRFVARFNKGGKFGTTHAFNVNIDLLQKSRKGPRWIGMIGRETPGKNAAERT